MPMQKTFIYFVAVNNEAANFNAVIVAEDKKQATEIFVKKIVAGEKITTLEKIGTAAKDQLVGVVCKNFV